MKRPGISAETGGIRLAVAARSTAGMSGAASGPVEVMPLAPTSLSVGLFIAKFCHGLGVGPRHESGHRSGCSLDMGDDAPDNGFGRVKLPVGKVFAHQG